MPPLCLLACLPACLPGLQGLDIPRGERVPEITGVLEALMGKLEKDKQALKLQVGVVCLGAAARSCPLLLPLLLSGKEAPHTSTTTPALLPLLLSALPLTPPLPLPSRLGRSARGAAVGAGGRIVLRELCADGVWAGRPGGPRGAGRQDDGAHLLCRLLLLRGE